MNLSALFELARAGDHTELTRRRRLVLASSLWHRPGCVSVTTATNASDPQLIAVLEVLAFTNLCSCVYDKWKTPLTGRELLRESAGLISDLRRLGELAVVTASDERPLDGELVGIRMLSLIARRRWTPPLKQPSTDLLRLMGDVHRSAARAFDVARDYQPDDDTVARWLVDHGLGHVDLDDRVTFVLAPWRWWKDYLHGKPSTRTQLGCQVGLWWLPQSRMPAGLPIASVPRGIADALTALPGPEAQIGVALPFELDTATTAALTKTAEPITNLAELRSHVTRVLAVRC